MIPSPPSPLSRIAGEGELVSSRWSNELLRQMHVAAAGQQMRKFVSPSGYLLNDVLMRIISAHTGRLLGMKNIMLSIEYA